MEVDEEGTVAAAATAVSTHVNAFASNNACLFSHLQVIMGRGRGPAKQPAKPEFICDRPFLCLLVHQASQLLLFAGKVVKPPAAAPSP